MAEGSDEGHKHPVSPAVTDCFTGFSAILLFHAALQTKWPRDWMGLTGYLDSTPLALSNDTNSFGIIDKSTEKFWSFFFFSTETSIERPHEFAHTRMSHDRVQPPLGSSVGIRVQNNWRISLVNYLFSSLHKVVTAQLMQLTSEIYLLPSWLVVDM